LIAGGRALFAVSAIGVLMALGASPALALEALSINPAWVPINTAPASAVSTIRGMGFTPATTVTFDGVAATVTFVNSRTLTVQVPTSASGKLARVVVSDPGGGSGDLYPFIYTENNIYVSESGNDSGNGTSPGTAKRTVRAGIDQSSSSTTNLILVTEGRFGDNQLPLPNGSVLAGGYDLTFTMRNPDVYITEVDSNGFGFNLRSFGLDAKVVVDGLTFMDGQRNGGNGGSIEFVGDQVVLSNSVVVGNAATAMGGGVYLGFTTSYGGRTTITNTVVVGNRAFGGAGGGIVIYPFYTVGNPVDVAISDNYIVGNRSMRSRGGGIAVQTNAFYGYNDFNLRVVGNTIAGNRANASAGVDFNLSTHTDALNLLMDNNVIYDNVTSGSGGGVTVGGLGMFRGSVTSNTVSGNVSSNGAGLTIDPSVSVDPGFEASDLILWGNLVFDASGAVTADYSDVGGSLLPGVGNISVTPDFKVGLRGRFYLAQNDPNAPVSPAVDAGSDTASALSLEGQTTAVDGTPDAGTVDMGAHFEVAPADSVDPIELMRLDPPQGNMAGTDWTLLRGKGFDPGARVNFGTPQPVNTIWISENKILAQPPPRGAITVNVTVTNPDMTSSTLLSAYKYVDNEPPEWVTTVGAQSALSPGDCVRSIIVDWNDAFDALSSPVAYEVYKFECVPSPPGAPLPCDNFGEFIPGASNLVATTPELSWIDTGFTANGPAEWLYVVRAIDAHAPPNRELNLAKRHGIAMSNAADTTPPALIGPTADFPTESLYTWGFSRGAVAFNVYREGAASNYSTPGSLTPFATVTTTQFTDTGVPFPGQAYYYRVTALDPCNVETTDDLLP